MLLRDIISHLRAVSVNGADNLIITDVTEHCDRVHSESIFVCRKGEHFDGNDFIEEARRRGAKAFISNNNLDINSGECLIISNNPRKTMAEILFCIFSKSFCGVRIIGVGGTKGKTTTAYSIAKALRHFGERVVVIGTLGIDFFEIDTLEKSKSNVTSGVGDSLSLSVNTTPEPDIIFKALTVGKTLGCTYAVIEISSQALALGRVYKLPIDIAVFTNFSKDHIGDGEHGDIDEYRAAKLSLYDGKTTVVNGDDALSKEIFKTAKKCYTVGCEASADFRISAIRSDGNRSSFHLNGVRFSLSFGGEFNAKNAALAIATVSVAKRMSPEHFGDCLSSLKINGRYEVYELSGRRIVIDFAHNLESFRAVLGAERRETKGRIIAVFGSIGGRSKDRRRDLAVIAEELADISVITSDNPANEPAQKICDEIYSFYKDKRKAIIEPDRESAIRLALQISCEADTLLLLGKGHEKTQLIGDERRYFSEKDIILSLGARRS